MRAVIRLTGALALVVLLAWLLLRLVEGNDSGDGGTRPEPGPSVSSSAFPQPSSAETERALDRLDELRTGTGGAGGRYDRESFGRGWADLDGDGCSTRNEILRRDLTEVRLKPNGCVVAAGTLLDPYGAQELRFEHGAETSQLVQIDHLVPLGYAWRQGAWRWSDAERLRFANDPNNLVAVSGELNFAKGSDGPGRWMPPNPAVHCGYAVAFVAVLAEYDLDAFPADDRELGRTLARC